MSAPLAGMSLIPIQVSGIWLNYLPIFQKQKPRTFRWHLSHESFRLIEGRAQSLEHACRIDGFRAYQSLPFSRRVA